ncbi:helix-turn-helix domain-containing protein [Streptomyces sp. RTd22]|uniref:helix-turn-helix domain-containing protein n=1 Tax=Streptomyces sp. RTd22 TaxID=1841249 RepID=UPI0007C47BAA|nr:helix-turn-helix transcriptional regulator [Streptomyces sp. RTd22]
MGLRANPTQRQRRLGFELRKLRDASGLSAAEAGAFAGLGSPHLGHIEAGRTAIPEVKLRALLAAYGCQSNTLIDALVVMSESTGKGWWSAHRKSSLDQSARDLAELESAAVTHRSFQWIYIPGLLQTPDYMRALFEGAEPEASSSTIDTYVEFRRQRQLILTGDAPPAFHAVIHEAALHMQFVGANVMRRQIEHLVKMARLPHVRIQVLPFRAGAYPARFGAPFVVYEHALPDLSTVYVEHPIASPFISDQAHLEQFTDAIAKLSAAALPPIDLDIEPEFHIGKGSLGLIQHLLYTL